MRERVVAILFVSAVAVTGCSRLATSAPAPPEITPASAEFQDAASEVELAGATWRVDAEAWRNVQPHAGGGGVPRCANLCVKVTVDPVDGQPDTDVTVEGVWAIRDDGMAPFEDFEVQETGTGLEVTAERGPRTDTGVELTVVVELTTEGSSTLVRSPRIEVGPGA